MAKGKMLSFGTQRANVINKTDFYCLATHHPPIRVTICLCHLLNLFLKQAGQYTELDDKLYIKGLTCTQGMLLMYAFVSAAKWQLGKRPPEFYSELCSKLLTVSYCPENSPVDDVSNTQRSGTASLLIGCEDCLEPNAALYLFMILYLTKGSQQFVVLA